MVGWEEAFGRTPKEDLVVGRMVGWEIEMQIKMAVGEMINHSMGGRGERGQYGRGISFDQGQSNSWNKEGQHSLGSSNDFSAGNRSSWSSGQEGNWDKDMSAEGSKKDGLETRLIVKVNALCRIHLCKTLVLFSSCHTYP